jgi:hypothetical protein
MDCPQETGATLPKVHMGKANNARKGNLTANKTTRLVENLQWVRYAMRKIGMHYTFRHEGRIRPIFHTRKHACRHAAANARRQASPQCCTYPRNSMVKLPSPTAIPFPCETCVLFVCIYKAIQVMLITMSMPIFSAPSHLYE